jgi:hypothetical protein
VLFAITSLIGYIVEGESIKNPISYNEGQFMPIYVIKKKFSIDESIFGK